jgi:hypothetical protein
MTVLLTLDTCVVFFSKMPHNGVSMASKGLRAISYQVTQKLKRATTLD